MKLRNSMLFLIVLLAASLLFGCSPKEMEQKLDSMEDSLEQQVEQTENKIENAINSNHQDKAPYSATITAEQAQAISLEHAGFNADQVTDVRTELELDDRVPHYDVQFHQGYLEYEYEIHADTGEIISYEKDD